MWEQTVQNLQSGFYNIIEFSFIYLFVCLFIYLFIYLFIHLFVFPGLVTISILYTENLHCCFNLTS